MKNKFIVFAALLQPVLLLLMVFYAFVPLYFGKEIIMQVHGYDPMDPFRGNYVNLRYDFNDINNIKKSKNYTILEEKNNIYYTKKITDKKPKSGIYIQGIYNNFGIQKYFTTEKNAIILQNKLSDPDYKAYAKIKIFKGNARIVEINFIKNNKK
ncbi:putative protein (GDYXXLXY domain) [Campylobacter pinnipediorum subsp. caledonicus]|uniref:Uncharacterized protein n=1 Tax=Campylobacter pinnipediorum subsp. caledonicus TaxID=1874362 RepID=A0A1S6U7K9_9BACT|nr:GDYXXLXY domain-containing protein [Campylobacter pinnipediorum]AQW86127.1 putative protein (GDYXXLXY domain) [Campylobacter pinnipediorum subsp. caledonicus]AQW87734.1 putative protein (GDYXXLXY domain) [Campylobacter pinnipediorum subsp. caledonicus]OPA72137.1 hypothetical protein BB381_00870 [Campylobacter pinnipediorum subsp. caledonicus]